MNKGHLDKDITKYPRRTKEGQLIIQGSLQVRSGQGRGWEGRAKKESYLEAVIPELKTK